MKLDFLPWFSMSFPELSINLQVNFKLDYPNFQLPNTTQMWSRHTSQNKLTFQTVASFVKFI